MIGFIGFSIFAALQFAASVGWFTIVDEPRYYQLAGLNSVIAIFYLVAWRR